MRILIYAIGRSGSTTIGKYISKSLSYLNISEPYNKLNIPHLNENDVWNKDNVVVKTTYGQIDMSTEELFKKFDKVVILTRENIKDQALSEHYASKTNQWTYPYTLKNFKIDESEFDKIYHWKEQITNELLNLNGFHITYEQIYDRADKIDELNEYLEIKNKTYMYLLNPKNRYRKEGNLQNKLI